MATAVLHTTTPSRPRARVPEVEPGKGAVFRAFELLDACTVHGYRAFESFQCPTVLAGDSQTTSFVVSPKPSSSRGRVLGQDYPVVMGDGRAVFVLELRFPARCFIPQHPLTSLIELFIAKGCVPIRSQIASPPEIRIVPRPPVWKLSDSLVPTWKLGREIWVSDGRSVAHSRVNGNSRLYLRITCVEHLCVTGMPMSRTKMPISSHSLSTSYFVPK